jgi:hypothetical protein
LQIEKPFFMSYVVTDLILKSEQTLQLTQALAVNPESIQMGGLMVSAEVQLSTETNQLSEQINLKKPLAKGRLSRKSY